MSSENGDTAKDVLLGDLFRPLVQYRRLIWQATMGSTIIAFLMGALYFALQPSAWSAGIGFRPIFEGADEGKYPNGLPFAAADITDASVVDQAFAKNDLRAYCALDDFRTGFSVQLSSTSLQFLSAEFQARLSDSRLTSVDRQRVQDEFVARRRALPKSYELMFVRPLECASLPQPVVLKAMSEILEIWAYDSEARRGVLKASVAVLSPEVFNIQETKDTALLVRADLVRAAIARVVANISEVEKLSGAPIVRAGKVPVTFAEVRVRLEDLMQARLVPLIRVAGRGFGRESVTWVTQELETANIQYRSAEALAEAYRQALREYSGVPTRQSSTSGPDTSRPQRSDVQALTPQIDRTFIDGIVEMSAPNIGFRQEITRNVIDAALLAASRESAAAHYRSLLAAMKEPGGESLPADEIVARLRAITAEAKALTELFNEIYTEFSRVAFRAGSSLYRIEQPAQVRILRAFSARDFVVLVAGVALGAPVVLSVACLVLFYFRRFVQSTVAA